MGRKKKVAIFLHIDPRDSNGWEAWAAKVVRNSKDYRVVHAARDADIILIQGNNPIFWERIRRRYRFKASIIFDEDRDPGARAGSNAICDGFARVSALPNRGLWAVDEAYLPVRLANALDNIRIQKMIIKKLYNQHFQKRTE